MVRKKKQFKYLDLYSKIKKQFNLNTEIFENVERGDRDHKLIEFMQKKISEDLNQLNENQRQHQSQIKEFYKDLNQVKQDNVDYSWFDVPSTH